jgi:quercetin dioxygenase-like cupin family protein
MEVYRITDRSEETAASSLFYVGTVGVHVLRSSINDGIEVRLMWFGPGSRSRPNVCSSGRLLHVVAGEAVVAGERTRDVVGPGDSVEVPAGEWHWHGGLPHVPAVILVMERPANVSWSVPAGDWADGYDPAAPPQ